MAEALIAIGSNLGDRRACLRLARRRLAGLPKTALIRGSAVYETPPVGPPGQGPYLNAAVRLETDLTPHAMLEAMQGIEREAGRDRASEVKWGPRTLDLDLLIHDGLIIDDDQLTLPHPEMHERGFVLVPLCDVARDVRHPRLGRTMGELLAGVSTEGVRRIGGEGW